MPKIWDISRFKMQLRISFKNAISVLEKSPYCSLVIIEKFNSNGLQFGRQQQPDARPTGHASPVAARALGDLSGGECTRINHFLAVSTQKY